MNMEPGLAELLDKQAIGEVLVRYCRGIDRCDPAVLASVYWPGARDNHGVYDGPAEGFIDFVLALLKTMKATSHCIGNVAIGLDGDRARGETYFTAHHIRDGEAGPDDHVVGGRYLDLFEKRQGEWRILDRLVVFDWDQAQPWTPRFADPAGRTFGGRWPDDVSYRRG